MSSKIVCSSNNAKKIKINNFVYFKKFNYIEELYLVIRF